MLRKSIHAASLLACVASLAACAAAPPARYAVATLEPTRGQTAAGTLWLTQDGPQVLIVGRLHGLKPNQEHGFHVHEKGDCSSPDATSAGGHLNPGGKPHGPPQAAHHAGDLPSLKADANGDAAVRLRVDGSVLGTEPGDFAGKAIVVHASPDDYATQPTGNSGARIACGVVSNRPGQDASGRALPMPTY